MVKDRQFMKNKTNEWTNENNEYKQNNTKAETHQTHVDFYRKCIYVSEYVWIFV